MEAGQDNVIAGKIMPKPSVTIDYILYREGYNYQLAADHVVATPFRPTKPIENDFVELLPTGILRVKEGFAWDGPSGPAIDTANFMRGSVIHDACYQLMREGCLNHETCREPTDRLLQQICLADGMSKLRAWWVYEGVRLCGDPAADPAHKRPILKAP